MEKLSKIKLQDAVVLENREMKMIYGGSGSGNGCNPANGHVCDDVPCSDIASGVLVTGRCKWEDTPIGRFCACVVGSGGSGSKNID